MIDPSPAFGKGFVGFSLWEVSPGHYQCSFKRRREQSFVIGYGATPEAAFSAAMEHAGLKKPRRDLDDLL